MITHAVPTASNAQEWLSDTQSVTYEAVKYANEGTTAHTLAELYLKHWLGELSQQEFTEKHAELKRYNENYSQNMEDYVADYVQYVTGQIIAARNYSHDVVVLLEQWLDLTPWTTGSCGRADVIIISGDVLEVIDLKYGRGVEILAENNAQLRLYGIGAYNLYKHQRNIHNVAMSVIQPRQSHEPRREMLHINDLLMWGETVKEKAQTAWNNGEGFSHKEKQTVYEHVTLADYELKKPPEMTDDELRETLGKVDAIEQWVKDVKEYATEQMVDNRQTITGWKIVNSKGRRKYTDEQKIIEALTQHYDIDRVAPRKVLGIMALEEEIGNKAFNELLHQQGLIKKQRGKLTIAPDSDYRPEVLPFD